MAFLKVCLLFSFAFFLLSTTKSCLADSSSSPSTAPSPSPPAPTTPHTSKECVTPCWNRCHDIKAPNIRPCMVICTRCCFKCDYVIPPKCQNWSNVTIEGRTYQCP